MTQKLEAILDQLHSDQNRIEFLQSVYTLGNIEVADSLLALSTDSEVLKAEIEHAKNSGNTDRFVSLSRQFIDYYVEHGLDISLRDEVIEWGNPELADYAIQQLSSNLKEGREESILEYSADIAVAFGKPEVATEMYERVLASQMKGKDEYAFSPAGTCVKLGRFDEAIDLYKQADYHWIDRAISIAREHKPERLTEVAQHAFNNYQAGFHRQEIYVEAADILGKTDKAKKVLGKEAKKLRPDSPPRFYEGLVTALMTLGMKQEARGVVAKVAEYEAGQAQTNELYSLDNQKELARLFEAIGDIAPVRDAYLIRIERGLKNRWHPSNIMRDIEKGLAVTGDSVFLEKKMLVLEQQKDYKSAAQVATDLGRTELAQTYSTMHQMVQSVQAQLSK